MKLEHGCGSRCAPLAAAFALAIAGCAKPVAPSATFSWIMGGSEPSFDPQGPPDSRRWAIERLLTHGLVAEDSSGRIVPAAAESIAASDDSLTWTFRLRPSLAYTDGAPCRSGDFRRALEDGLARTDHGTFGWLLAAVRGVDQVRVGKPLPAKLGIETPDDGTLVLHLVRRDRLLLEKLAVPGVTDAWREAGGAWSSARGLGPYRVAAEDPARRLTLVPAPAAPRGARAPDTLWVRFGVPPGRTRSMLRAGGVDLVWPLPVGMLDQPVPDGFRIASRAARPRRQMLLVMRVDLPPTSKLPARQALAHGINRDGVLRLLDEEAVGQSPWLMGAEPGDYPALDQDEIARWMDRGKLGRSFHVNLAYRGDGPAAEIARAMQGEWSRYAIYVEPSPLKGDRWSEEALGGLSHLLLTESQAVLDDPAAELAQVAMPVRGPAVGAWRSGWRTREFDAWIGLKSQPGPLPVAALERRLEDELITLPLADLPWVWVERSDAPLPCHPHFGPECILPAPGTISASGNH